MEPAGAARDGSARAAPGWRVAAAPIALALFVAGLYAPALRNGFVYDDRILILEQPAPREASDLGSVFSERHWWNLPYYRPVSRLTMVLQKALHGNEPAPFHAFNVALAVAAALLLFALLRQPRLGVARGPALLAAALFAAHPVMSDCVYPVSSGRETLLPVVFSLAALLAWLRRGAVARVLAWLATALALFAKEQAIVLPALFVWADGLAVSADPPGRSARRWAARFAPVAALTVAYLAVRARVLGGGGLHVAVFDAPQGPVLSLLYALQTTFTPFAELVYEPRLPVWLSVPRLAIALAAAAALAVLAARLGGPRRTALFFAGCAGIALLPTANLLVQEAPFAERYGLLWLAGVAGVAAAAASGLRGRGVRRAVGALAVALVLAAAAASRARAPAWADDLAFHEQWIHTDPEAAQPQVGLGQWFDEAGDVDESIAHYEAAIALRPDYAVAHASLGAVLLHHGRLAEAVPRLERAATLAPGEAATWSNLGVALSGLGRSGEAEAAAARAVELAPDFAEAHANLAALLAERGDAARAAAEYRVALGLAPSMVGAAIGLAEVLAASPDPALRDGREALAWAQRAVRATDRRSARALAALAAAFAETGHFDAAVRWQQRALALAAPERAADHAARLALYREGRPWRRPRPSGFGAVRVRPEGPGPPAMPEGARLPEHDGPAQSPP